MWWRTWWNKIRVGTEHRSIATNRKYFREFHFGNHIWDYDFVVFDAEFTGLNPRIDEIVALAAVRVRGKMVMVDESFHSYLRTKKTSFGEGTLVHRITPELVQTAPEPKEVLPRFVDFCGESVLVGHFPSLDFSFLDRACRKTMGGIIMNPCLDSMELARTYLRNQKRHGDPTRPRVTSLNLSELSEACNVPQFQTHDALGDALQTACLFIYLVDRLVKDGLHTLKDFTKAGYVR